MTAADPAVFGADVRTKAATALACLGIVEPGELPPILREDSRHRSDRYETGGRLCHSAAMSQKRATAIHLFENDGRIRPVNFSAGEWESPYWAVGDTVAEDLKAGGGDIYFHKAQTAPSYFGGRVFDYRKQPDGQWAGRIIFLFRFDEDHRGVPSGRGGWSQAMKIIWQTDDSKAASRAPTRRPKPLAPRPA